MYKHLLWAFGLLLSLTIPFTDNLTAQSETMLRVIQTDDLLTVEVTNAVDLFAIEFTIDFDPTLLTIVEDKLVSGDCPSGEFPVVNSADNTKGLISYAVSQLTSEPCNSGTVATFSIECTETNETIEPQLHFGEHLLASREGLAIEHKVESVSITCPESRTIADNQTVLSQPIVSEDVEGDSLAFVSSEEMIQNKIRTIGSSAEEVSLLKIDETDNAKPPMSLFIALLGAVLLIVVSVTFIIQSQSARTYIEERLE